MSNTCALEIKNYHCDAIIGVYASERKTTQPIFITLNCQYKHNAVLVSDAIEDAIDYDAVTTFIRKTVQKTSFQLIESLAHHLYELLIKTYDLSNLTLTLQKPNALKRADYVSITLS